MAFLSPYFRSTCGSGALLRGLRFRRVRDIYLEARAGRHRQVAHGELREKLKALNGAGREADARIQVGRNLSMVRRAAAAELWLGKRNCVQYGTYRHALRAYGSNDKVDGFERQLKEF